MKERSPSSGCIVGAGCVEKECLKTVGRVVVGGVVSERLETGGIVTEPLPGGMGQIGLQFEEFGVRLNLLPVDLGNGRIRCCSGKERCEEKDEQ